MVERAAASVSRRQRRRAARLAESAARYDPALEGRRRTAIALDRLPMGTWTVLHDVPWPGRRGAKIDHVAIGAPGIFVIQAVDWPWPVWTWEERLTQEGHALAAVEDAAWAVAQLTPSVPMRLVHPVICLVRDQSISGQIDDVLVCSTGNVAEVLDARVHELSLDQQRVAPMHLRAHLLNSSAAKVPPAPPRTVTPASKPPRQPRLRWRTREEAWRRGRKQPGLVLPLLATLAAALLLIAAPGLVIAGARAFGQLFAEYLAR